GVCHHVTGALDVAIRSYTRALSCDPEYALAENNAAVALANQGDVTAAREALQSLADRGAAFPEAWSNLGLLAFQAGRREEALRAYRAAAAAAPESPAGWLGVAAVLAEEGRVGAARNAVARAIEVAPDSAEARYRLAFRLNRLGDVKGSLREPRRALSLNPYFTSPRLRLAIGLQFEFSEVLAPEIGGDEGSGAVSALSDFTVRREQISAAFDRLRGGAPAGSEARGYRKATEYLARGAYQKALAEIRLVAIGGGDPVEAALLTGEALKRQGLEGEALERFDSALARLEGSPWSERHERAWLGRGECLLALSRPTL